ncbi:MAG: hypothetical protein HGA23_09000, partial [Bacteroidales bacterium]|nr:hypothetical protein [Bacteroidales bacterium]
RPAMREQCLLRARAQHRYPVRLYKLKNTTAKRNKYIKEFIDPIHEALAAKGFDFEKLTYFLPHLSSQYFAPRIDKEMVRMGLNIPVSKWFTNLSWVGNVGAASPYLMLEELFHSGKLNKGDTLLMGIPESARFNYAYALLTVV